MNMLVHPNLEIAAEKVGETALTGKAGQTCRATFLRLEEGRGQMVA
jgi:hypothetical protein